MVDGIGAFLDLQIANRDRRSKSSIAICCRFLDLPTRFAVATLARTPFVDGYCSTVQGLLDWFEVDLGFTELSLIQIDLCVLCVFVLYSRVSLSSCPFLDILHWLPRAVGVPLESALNLVSQAEFRP